MGVREAELSDWSESRSAVPFNQSVCSVSVDVIYNMTFA